MFFSLQVLEKRAIDFGEEFRPGVIDLGSEARQQGALKSSGQATLVTERHGRKGVIQDIRVVGTLATAVEQPCARCLELVASEVSRSFDLLYRPLGSDAGREEMSVTEAEAEISYYQGDGLLLEDVLREQILLALPMRVVCSEECKGLCPRCGQNLNLGPCPCPAPVADPRWAALQGLREKLDR
jgi:uncharacterized protein